MTDLIEGDNPRATLLARLQGSRDKETADKFGGYTLKDFDARMDDPAAVDVLWNGLSSKGLVQEDRDTFGQKYGSKSISTTKPIKQTSTTPTPPAPQPGLLEKGWNAVVDYFKPEPQTNTPLPQPKQWESEAQLKQEASSPLFKENALAQEAIKQPLIFQTKEAERRGPVSKEAIEGSSGAPLAEERRREGLGVAGRAMEDAGSLASGFNRAVFKTPSGVAKTAAELGTGVLNSLGGDFHSEDDMLFKLADKYDKWFDESETAKNFIADPERQGLAADIGSGLGQITTLIASGAGGAARSLAQNPTLWKEVGKKILSKPNITAFTQVFSSSYEDQIKNGESDMTAFKHALANGLAMAPLENLPLANLGERLAKATNPTLAVKFMNSLIQGAEEGSQEALQQVFSNFTNNQLVEAEKNIVDWAEGLPNSASAGSAVGFILGALTNAHHRGPTKLGGQSTVTAPEGPNPDFTDGEPVNTNVNPDLAPTGVQNGAKVDEGLVASMDGEAIADESTVSTGATPGAATEVVPSEPGTPVSEEGQKVVDVSTMSSSDLDSHIKNEENVDKKVLGDKYEAYRAAQKITNNPSSTSQQSNEAQAKIDEIESSLSEDQRNQLFGIGQEGANDLEDLKNHQSHIIDIENAPDVNNLSILIKDDFLRSRTLKNDPFVKGIFNSALSRAKELGIQPEELLKKVVADVAQDIPNPREASDLIAEILGPVESTQQPPTLPANESPPPTPLPASPDSPIGATSEPTTGTPEVADGPVETGNEVAEGVPVGDESVAVGNIEAAEPEAPVTEPVVEGDPAIEEEVVSEPVVEKTKPPVKEKKPATQKKEATEKVPREAVAARNYIEARDLIQEGTELSKEEMEEELPYFLNQMGLGQLNEKTKPKEAARIYSDLTNLSQEELLDTDSKIAGKVARFVQSQQTEAGISPKSAADKVLEWTASQREQLKGTATSGGALYKALLDAIDLAVKGAKTAKEVTQAIAKAIEDFRSKYTNQQKAQAEQAIAHFKKGAPVSAQKQLGTRNEKTKQEVQRAINKAFDFGVAEGKELGERTGIAEGKKAAAATLKTALLGLKAQLNPRQINGLLDRIAKQKDFSPEGKQRFQDYADKVVDDANYVLQERAGTNLKNRVGKLSQSGSIPANDASLFRAFSGLSIGHMESDILQEYIDWGNKIIGRALAKGDRALLTEFIQDQKEVQDQITADRSSKMKAGRERNLQDEFDRLESEGELPDGATTFEEFVESKKPKSKAETVEQKASRIKDQLSNIPDQTDPDQNRVVDALKKADLFLLSSDDLDFISNALNSFEDTGKMFGMGEIATKAEVLTKVDNLVKEGVKFNKEVDKKDSKRLSLTHIFNKFFSLSAQAAKARAVIIQDWLSKSSGTFINYSRLEGQIFEEAARLKLKETNWNRINQFGFLNEAEGNPELFEQLLNQKKQDLATLKEAIDENPADDSASRRAKIDNYETLKESMESLGALKDGATLESIEANLSPNELSLYNTARKALDKYSAQAIRNIELYSNREVGVVNNYWPRQVFRMKDRASESIGEVEEFHGWGDHNKAGKDVFGRQKGRKQLAGKSGYYNPSGQMNFFNGLRETMMIAEAAHQYYQMRAMFNSGKGFDRLLKGDGAQDMKQYFVDMVMNTKNHGSFTGKDDRNMWQKAADNTLQALTSSAIKNPTQLPKQLTSLAFTTLTAPKATARASQIVAELIRDKALRRDTPLMKAYNDLINNSTLALRLAIPEILSFTEKYVGDKGPLSIWAGKASHGLNAALLGEVITDADKAASVIATLAGYIQHQVEMGKLKSEQDFSLEKEAENGFDSEALSAGEQLQGKTNSENSRLLFSKEVRENPRSYFLSTFTYNAVRNLRVNWAKAVNSALPKAERQAAALEMIAWLGQAVMFAMAANLTEQGIAYLVGAALGDDDDEKLKEIREQANDLKRDKIITSQLLSTVGGTLPVYGQEALNYAVAGAFALWQKTQRDKGSDSEMVEKDYNPFYKSGLPGREGLLTDNLIDPMYRLVDALAKDEKTSAELGLMLAQLTLPILKQGSLSYGLRKVAQEVKMEEKANQPNKKTSFRPRTPMPGSEIRRKIREDLWQ